MCFDVNNSKKCIAKSDITVYKLVQKLSENSCMSEYYNFVYFKNEKNKKIDLEIKSYSINEGYHSYDESLYLLIKKIRQIEYVVLSWTKFIIPEGTIYYYNDLFKEYVSEEIIFKEYV